MQYIVYRVKKRVKRVCKAVFRRFDKIKCRKMFAELPLNTSISMSYLGNKDEFVF